MDKEIDQDLFIEITTKAEPMLPININKYFGSTNVRQGRWQSLFGRKYKSSTHDSREEAEAHIRAVNVELGWKVKNVIYKYKDEYYCELTQNQLMKFSVESADLVEKYVLYADYDDRGNTFYAYCKREGVRIAFHSILLPNTDRTKSTDHINRITLDNTLPNIRIVSTRTQVINRGLWKSNTSGFCGVHMNNGSAYHATWRDEQGKRAYRSFSISQYGKEGALIKAINYRKETIARLPHYKIALGI